MSSDIVRSSDFGKDLGLLHELVITGRKVGAGSDFYAALAHDEDLFRRTLEMVRGTAKQDPRKAAAEALQAAVEKGVQVENGYYRFLDPGLPLITLRDLPIVRQQYLVYSQNWYDKYQWATREEHPRERLIRLPVDGSFAKTSAEQERLLRPDEEVPSARTVAIFLVIHTLATGTRLLSDCYVRCGDRDSGGVRVIVGNFDRGGLNVDHYYWDDDRNDDVGLAASRKF